MASNTLYWLFSTGSISSCTGDLSSYTFPASVCQGTLCDIQSLQSGSSNAAVAVGTTFYGPSGQPICDGQQRIANLASSAGSGTTSVGTYACAIGSGSLDTSAPCNRAQSLGIAYQAPRNCDILFYRDEDPTPCTEMIGCDASQENCLSYLGDYYRCDGSVQTGGAQGGPADAYICSCVSQVVDAPQRGGGFSFPGAVPRSGGCGLPLVAPAPPAGPPSSTSLSSSSTSAPTSTSSSTVNLASASSVLASISSSLEASASSVASAASASAASVLSSQSIASASSASAASAASVAAVLSSSSVAAQASSSVLASLSSISAQSAASAAAASSAASAAAASSSNLAPATASASSNTATSTSQVATASPTSSSSADSSAILASSLSSLSISAFSSASSQLSLASQSILSPFNQDNGNSGGLSTGAKIGIGVGAGVGGLLALALLAWALLRRRRPSRVEYESTSGLLGGDPYPTYSTRT